MHAYESALSAAIQQDQVVLESIQKNWAEVTKRITQRANLLQTLQTTGQEQNDQQELGSPVAIMANTIVQDGVDRASMENDGMPFKNEVTSSQNEFGGGSKVLDVNLQTIGSSVHQEAFSKSEFKEGNSTNVLASILHPENQDDGDLVHGLKDIDRSYQNQKILLLHPGQKTSPDARPRAKNDIKRLASLYRPGAQGAQRQAGQKLVGTQNPAPNRAAFQSLRAAEARISTSNKRSVQGSRGRGLKGPAVQRGASAVHGSMKNQTVYIRDGSPMQQNLMSQNMGQSELNAVQGQTIPTASLQTDWEAQQHSYETLTAGSGFNRGAVVLYHQQPGRIQPKNLNTMTVGEVRRAQSKSTMRSDVRNLNDQLINHHDQLQQASQTRKTQKPHGSRSVRRSRPIVHQVTLSASIQNNAKIRRNQTSAIIQKVQLKKTIQHATYQGSQSDIQQSLLVSKQNFNSLNSTDAVQIHEYASFPAANHNAGNNPADESALVITRSPKASCNQKQIVIHEFQNEGEDALMPATAADLQQPYQFQLHAVERQQLPDKRRAAPSQNFQEQKPGIQLQKATTQNHIIINKQPTNAYNQSQTRQKLGSSQGRAVSVPPMMKQQSQQPTQRRGTLGTNDQYGREKLVQPATASLRSGKFNQLEHQMVPHGPQNRSKYQKRGSTAANSHAAPPAMARNAKVLVQSGRIRPQAGQNSSVHNQQKQAAAAKQSSLNRKGPPTKSQRLQEGRTDINVKNSGPGLAAQNQWGDGQGKEAGMDEVSRSKYHDQNILLGLGMSSQGMSQEIRQVMQATELNYESNMRNDINQIKKVKSQIDGPGPRGKQERLIIGHKQMAAAFSIDPSTIQMRGDHENSQSPELQTSAIDGKFKTIRPIRMLANQGIISNQFSFENGDMQVRTGDQDEEDIKKLSQEGELEMRPNKNTKYKQKSEAGRQIKADGAIGTQQQQNRYGEEAWQEETVRHAVSSVPLKVSHVLNQLSQNLSDQKILEEVDDVGEAPAHNLTIDNTIDESKRIKDMADTIMANERAQMGNSPFELDPRMKPNDGAQMHGSSQELDGYAIMNESELVMKKLYNQQSNRGRKILISQIIENSKNQNIVSASYAIQHQHRLENFNQNLDQFENSTNHHQNRRAHNETVNSSNLVMNQRDRQNIRDFLSANHSAAGNAGLDLDALSDLNAQNCLIINQNMQLSSGGVLQNQQSEAQPQADGTYKLALGKNLSNMQFKTKDDRQTSQLKHMAAGNPLLNDSMNRSQLSGNIIVSALALSPLESSEKKIKALGNNDGGPAMPRALGGAPNHSENPIVNQREKLNQRYQEDCEETMMVVNEQQCEEDTQREQVDSGRVLDEEPPQAILSAAEMTDQDEGEELVEEILHSQSRKQHQYMRLNDGSDIQMTYDQPGDELDEINEGVAEKRSSVNFADKSDTQPSMQNAIKTLIPFDADDEPADETEENTSPERVHQEDLEPTAIEVKNEASRGKDMELPFERPKFVRKRQAQNRGDDNASSENGMRALYLRSNDPTVVESGQKNTQLSTNSTALGIGGLNPANKTDHFNNSKTTVSSPNTFNASQNPNILQLKNPLPLHQQANQNATSIRKSAFLFGSQTRGTSIAQNNLRYSQQQNTAMQQPGATTALRNNLRMKSVALNLSKLNEMTTTGQSAGVEASRNPNAPVKSCYIDESAVVQEAEEIEGTDAIIGAGESELREAAEGPQADGSGQDTRQNDPELMHEVRQGAKTLKVNSGEDKQDPGQGFKLLDDTRLSAKSRTGNLIVSDQITEQYAEEQDHTSASLAKSCQDQDESNANSIIPSEHTGRSVGDEFNAEQQHRQLMRHEEVIQVELDADSDRMCTASPPILGAHSSDRIRSSRHLSQTKSPGAGVALPFKASMNVSTDNQRALFAQKMELIKSMAASECDDSASNDRSESKKELSCRNRQTERSARVEDIEEIEDIDLLHDKIFQRLNNEPAKNKVVGAALRPSANQDTSLHSKGRRDSISRHAMSLTDDVMIESLTSLSNQQLSNRQYENQENSKSSLVNPQQPPKKNKYIHQFENSGSSRAYQPGLTNREQQINTERSGLGPPSDVSVNLDEHLEQFESSAEVVGNINKKNGAINSNAKGGGRAAMDGPDFYRRQGNNRPDEPSPGRLHSYRPQQWSEVSGDRLRLSSRRSGRGGKRRDEQGNTMPAHSDDEVTPRRGLDEQMSEDKLRQLNEELDRTDGDGVLLSQDDRANFSGVAFKKRGSEAPANKDDDQSEVPDLISDLNDREDIEASIILQPNQQQQHGQETDKLTKSSETTLVKRDAQKPLTTPRLFLGLNATAQKQGTAKEQTKEKQLTQQASGDLVYRSDDGDSACNLVESSRSIQSNRGAVDSQRGNQRYQVDDGDDRQTPFMRPSPGRSPRGGDQESMILASQMDPGMQAINAIRGVKGLAATTNDHLSRTKVNKRDLKSIENWASNM